MPTWIQVQISTSSPRLTVWLDDLAFGADSRRGDRQLVPGPDRAAAEYVVATHGTAQAWVLGKTVAIRATADIPKDSFKITSIYYDHGQPHPDVTDMGLKLLGMLTDCRDLNIQTTSVSDVGFEHLKDMNAVESLCITGRRITGTGLRHFANQPKLTRLVLNGTAAGDQQMAYLLALPNLTHLDLGNMQVTDEGLERLSAHPALSSIHIDNTRITENGLRHLKALPAGLQNLLVSTANAPQGLAVLQRAPLRSLSVHANGSNGRIEDAFLESLRLFPDLNNLGINAAIIDEKAMTHVSQLPNLRTLHVHAPRGGIAAGALRQLATTPKLEDFSFNCTTASEDNLRELTALTRLKRLGLTALGVEPAGVLKLQAALPDCKITVDPDVQKAIDQLRAKQ